MANEENKRAFSEVLKEIGNSPGRQRPRIEAPQTTSTAQQEAALPVSASYGGEGAAASSSIPLGQVIPPSIDSQTAGIMAMEAMKLELEKMRKVQEDMMRARMTEMMNLTAEHFTKQLEAQTRGAAEAVQGVAQAAEGMMTTMAKVGLPKHTEEHEATTMDIDEDMVYQKLNDKLDKDLVKQIKAKATTLKKSLDRVAREEKRLETLTRNQERLSKGHIPTGLKPFRCGDGPSEMDEQIGVDFQFSIMITKDMTVKEAKEVIHFEMLKIGTSIDQQLTRNVIAAAKPLSSLRGFGEGCKELAKEYMEDIMKLDIETPPEMFEVDTKEGRNLVIRLYKGIVLAYKKRRDKEKADSEKEQKKKESIIEQILNADPEILLKEAQRLELKKPSELKKKLGALNLDWAKVQELATNHDQNGLRDLIIESIEKKKDGGKVSGEEAKKRRFSKKELSMRKKSKNGWCPGGGPGKLQKNKGFNKFKVGKYSGYKPNKFTKGQIKGGAAAPTRSKGAGKGKGGGKAASPTPTFQPKGKGKGKGAGQAPHRSKGEAKGKSKGKGKAGKNETTWRSWTPAGAEGGQTAAWPGGWSARR